MSEMAKQARAAMKAKASKMTTADPHQKVDSSTWTPPEPLNTEVKTGLRPLSRRAFKTGGKVTGVKAKMNLGKSTRTGNKPVTPDNLANKDVKAANEDRMGLKHIGGLKTGGRAKKQAGGGNMPLPPRRPDYLGKIPAPTPEDEPISPAMQNKMRGIMNRDAAASRAANAAEQAKQDYEVTGQKRGGKVAKCWGGQTRSKKFLGGPMMDPENPAGVQNKAFKFGQDVVTPGLKKGGAAKHPDEKMDIALIKKMVKPEARKARKDGGGIFSGPGYPGKVPGVTGGRQAHATRGRAVKNPLNYDRNDPSYSRDAKTLQDLYEGNVGSSMDKPPGQSMMRPEDWAAIREMGTNQPSQAEMYQKMKNDAHYEAMRRQYDDAIKNSLMRGERLPENMMLPSMRDTGVSDYGREYIGLPPQPEMSGADYPGLSNREMDSMTDMPRRSGGRVARATGGKTKGKGKTNINIVIAAGKPGMGQQGMMPPGGPTPPPGMDGGPGGRPVPIPSQAPAGAAPMPMPMPIPMPMGGAGPAPAPMARKSGGRISKVASSYKDMTAGAGSGEGRLQKTDIAKRSMRKAGGKVYRSYKDMDAGAGSGKGRLEKTEIQAHKG